MVSIKSHNLFKYKSLNMINLVLKIKGHTTAQFITIIHTYLSIYLSIYLQISYEYYI